MKRLNDIKYEYKSLSVPGGGFVTGFIFHPRNPDILYARTDIGGIYRFDFSSELWLSLGSFITEYQHHLTRPLSIALDPDKPNMLYAMCGDSRHDATDINASIIISDDYGNSFTEKKVPFPCNGNAPARSTAERLAFYKGSLFFGSQGKGIWRSDDEGESWRRLDFPENDIVFLYITHDSGVMIVSCTGETCSDGDNRGHTLYMSCDMGETFEKIPVPESLNDERCNHNGFVAGGIAYHNDKFLITFTYSCNPNPWGKWNNFACDNGGGFDGRLYLYELKNNKLSFSKDLTPKVNGFSDKNKNRKLPFGLGGIDFFGDTIAVCSVGGHGDGIFISKDFGNSYNVIKSTDLDRFVVDVPYLKPEYNGGRIPLHWMSCLKINPFNHDFALINTGTGVFSLNSLTSIPYVKTLCYGMEETVHMNIYGIPKGKNNVIDLVGDLGGFAFRDLTKPCENSFADDNNHRYITCLNADFVQNDPDTFITTARGNWTGHTTGGVILTTDGGDTFKHIGFPNKISSRLDEVIADIKRPNYNSGWAAISSDGKIILWTLAHKYMQLPCFCAVRYDRGSQSFSKIKVFDLSGNDISESDLHIKLFSDRINPELFYGFGENGQVYISRDKGKAFYQVQASDNFPHFRMSGIDGLKGCEIRFLPTEEGVCYAALLYNGLWKIRFTEKSAEAVRVTEEGDFVKAVGFGIGDRNDTPALYISGTIFNEYGFWRSFDEGESWAKINNENQMFGSITSMDGDFRKHGRVYIATGFTGGIYGEEI